MARNEVTLCGFIADDGIKYWPKTEKRTAMALVTLKVRSANAGRGHKFLIDYIEIIFRGKNATICGTKLRGGLYCVVLGRIVRDKWKNPGEEKYNYRTRVAGSVIALALNAKAQETAALAEILAEEELQDTEPGESDDDF